jgi:hypothetical protein
MKNPFLLEKSQYKREINPVEQYVDQVSFYLNMMTGKPVEECKAFVKSSLANKQVNSQIKNPKVVYFERQDNGDRISKETTLLGYLGNALAKEELIAPTLTTYVNPKVKESLLVNFVDDNVAARGKAKKEMFAARAAGQTELDQIKNIEQTNKKLSNNSVSGAHVSASTPLFNKTAHSTLTSTCRSTSGYGNANNEKFLCGNRHYWSSDVVINNIVSIVTNTDYPRLEKIVAKYNLKSISVEEALSCVTYSTDLYWTNSKGTQLVKSVLDKLTPIQRQAFVYTGDMYHLMIHNEVLVRKLVTGLSTKITGLCEDALNVVKKSSEDIVNFSHQICFKEMMGKGVDHKALLGTVELQTVAMTVKNIESVLTEYSDLIQALWVTNNVPASVAYFPESIRRAALTSDTDSTIFTVQDWVKWYSGEIGFEQEHMSVAATMIFLASQTITHVLAKMSANFGISEKRLGQIAMKNEFKFDVFVPTQVAKHYFAVISCQEGSVYKKLKKEIKGVHLKSSNVPIQIIKQATDLMESIMTTVIAGKKIKIKQVLKEIADSERNIAAAINKGNLEYFRLAQIKTPASYKSHERSSPYGHHLFWNEVFGAKYGKLVEPPYSCVKVSTILDNPTAMKAWVDSIADKDVAARAARWIVENNKDRLPTLLLSVETIQSKGFPVELANIIDVRTMVSDLTSVFYLILETLGVYLSTDKKTKLVSDFH